MVMGRWSRERESWIATEQMSATPRHVFYERLNQLLGQAGFDVLTAVGCGGEIEFVGSRRYLVGRNEWARWQRAPRYDSGTSW